MAAVTMSGGGDPSDGGGGDATTSTLLETLRKLLRQSSTPPTPEPPIPQITIKFDGTNFGLWSQVVEMFISGKDKLGYITGDVKEPPMDDPNYRRLKTEDQTVKSWLINSMIPELIGNFIRFPTARAEWRGIRKVLPCNVNDASM